MASIQRIASQVTSGTGASSLNLSLPAAPTPGWLQIITALTNVTTISVPNFQTAKLQSMGPSSGWRVGIFYRVTQPGDSGSISLTATSATTLNGHWFEYAFCDPVPLDKTAGQSGGTSTRTSWASGTAATTAQAVELSVAAFGFTNTTSSGHSASNGFSVIRSTNRLVTVEKIRSTAGQETTTLSWSGAVAVGGCVATLKAGLGRKHRESGVWVPKPAAVRVGGVWV